MRFTAHFGKTGPQKPRRKHEPAGREKNGMSRLVCGFLAVLLYVMRDDSSCKEVIVTLVCNRPAVLEFYGNDIDAFRIRYGHHHSAFRQVPIADDQTEAGENPYHPEEDNDTKQEPDCPPRSLAATKQ